MPLYDVYCSVCEVVEEDVWLKVNEEVPACPTCNGKRCRLCNCHTFKLRYDPKKDSCGWAYDGYASSMYWNDVKKLRAEGKKVKGCNEN